MTGASPIIVARRLSVPGPTVCAVPLITHHCQQHPPLSITNSTPPLCPGHPPSSYYPTTTTYLPPPTTLLPRGLDSSHSSTTAHRCCKDSLDSIKQKPTAVPDQLKPSQRSTAVVVIITTNSRRRYRRPLPLHSTAAPPGECSPRHPIDHATNLNFLTYLYYSLPPSPEPELAVRLQVSLSIQFSLFDTARQYKADRSHCSSLGLVHLPAPPDHNTAIIPAPFSKARQHIRKVKSWGHITSDFCEDLSDHTRPSTLSSLAFLTRIPLICRHQLNKHNLDDT